MFRACFFSSVQLEYVYCYTFLVTMYSIQRCQLNHSATSHPIPTSISIHKKKDSKSSTMQLTQLALEEGAPLALTSGMMTNILRSLTPLPRQPSSVAVAVEEADAVDLLSRERNGRQPQKVTFEDDTQMQDRRRYRSMPPADRGQRKPGNNSQLGIALNVDSFSDIWQLILIGAAALNRNSWKHYLWPFLNTFHFCYMAFLWYDLFCTHFSSIL